eukprot:SAG22_NODE_3193_length_1863_cov_30.122449_1_plen_244_part_00
MGLKHGLLLDSTVSRLGLSSPAGWSVLASSRVRRNISSTKASGRQTGSAAGRRAGCSPTRTRGFADRRYRAGCGLLSPTSPPRLPPNHPPEDCPRRCRAVTFGHQPPQSTPAAGCTPYSWIGRSMSSSPALTCCRRARACHGGRSVPACKVRGARKNEGWHMIGCGCSCGGGRAGGPRCRRSARSASCQRCRSAAASWRSGRRSRPRARPARQPRPPGSAGPAAGKHHGSRQYVSVRTEIMYT